MAQAMTYWYIADYVVGDGVQPFRTVEIPSGRTGLEEKDIIAHLARLHDVDTSKVYVSHFRRVIK